MAARPALTRDVLQEVERYVDAFREEMIGNILGIAEEDRRSVTELHDVELAAKVLKRSK